MVREFDDRAMADLVLQAIPFHVKSQGVGLLRIRDGRIDADW